MKFAVLIAALLGVTANASSHLRVHVLGELVRPGLDEQCEWKHKAIKCQVNEHNLYCAADGFCRKKETKSKLNV
ncbi:hypothetical protein KXD40_000802 [Peronospora effusa]|uniref:Uncharacterized protein n=1 Tax=Peronospora effusa TaxID=542832 RepID=A0A3M6VL07_9STRA|nr:hypothetical protein DD238_004827 [Peronospora effusa]RQM16341.1 hypothetical protein DD237_003881 [Peronospora effusa]UIZ21317.1 hypothetical protein KXD40_000802 [Peronospora effusa]